MRESETMKFIVDEKIFEKFPEVKIGVVFCRGVDNKKSKKEALALLRGQEKYISKFRLVVSEPLINEVKMFYVIEAWQEAYRKFGADPRKYKSSIEALLLRIANDQLLPDINPLVNLYNYCSLKYLLPFGGEDLDKVKGDIHLTISNGTEKGRYLGGQKDVIASEGEVIYKDALGFICRRWNWREAERTKLTEETENAIFEIELLEYKNSPDLEEVTDDFGNLIKKHLGGEVNSFICSEENPIFEFDFEPGKRLMEREIKETVDIEKAPKAVREQDSRLGLSKDSLAYKLKEALYQALLEVDKGLGESVTVEDIHLEHPAEPGHGDFASNLALVLAGRLEESPRELAEAIVAQFTARRVKICHAAGQEERGLKSATPVARVEVAGPGFINFWLSDEFLTREVQKIIAEDDDYGSSRVGEGRKILLEHTSPDPIKTIHIGHLRNNFLGMAVSRILENCGYEVTKDCINNDRGMHVSRAMWGYLVFGRKDVGIDKEALVGFKVDDDSVKEIAEGVEWRQLLKQWLESSDNWLVPEDLDLKPDHFDLRVYSLGARAENLVGGVAEQVREILRAWEAEDKKVRALWRRIIDWSLEGYRETYQRIGSKHDFVWHESDLYQGGKELVREGAERGIFRKLPDGAILSDLSEYELPDAILLKSDGTSLYHTYDLNLTKSKREKFPADLYIWCIGSDQTLYLQQLFALCEQLGIGNVEDYFHLNYGYVTLKGEGKMSSRAGTIVSADELLDHLHDKGKEIIEESDPKLRGEMSKGEKESVSEQVALAAIKYGLLRPNREKDIEFDPEESVSLEGDSGPYLQYTYARCKSVLRKGPGERGLGKEKRRALGLVLKPGFGELPSQSEEENLLRTFYKFPEVVEEAAEVYSPNLICSFLFDLAQKYNLFYNRCPILRAETEELRDLRLAITAATAQILKNGLRLLGIEALERM